MACVRVFLLVRMHVWVCVQCIRLRYLCQIKGRLKPIIFMLRKERFSFYPTVQESVPDTNPHSAYSHINHQLHYSHVSSALHIYSVRHQPPVPHAHQPRRHAPPPLFLLSITRKRFFFLKISSRNVSHASHIIVRSLPSDTGQPPTLHHSNTSLVPETCFHASIIFHIFSQ